MTKNAKLTPAMQRVMQIVERHGYVDLIRDGRTYRRTVDAMIGRGVLREFGWWRRGVGYRYYPTNTPEQVWDEAHAAQDAREQCGCLRNPLGHSRAEHPQPLTAKEMTDQMSTEGRQVVRDAAHAAALAENEAREILDGDQSAAAWLFADALLGANDRQAALDVLHAEAADDDDARYVTEGRELLGWDRPPVERERRTDMPCLAMTGDRRYSGGLRAANGHDHLIATGPECNDAWSASSSTAVR